MLSSCFQPDVFSHTQASASAFTSWSSIKNSLAMPAFTPYWKVSDHGFCYDSQCLQISSANKHFFLFASNRAANFNHMDITSTKGNKPNCNGYRIQAK
jgi:hypothetical protein